MVVRRLLDRQAKAIKEWRGGPGRRTLAVYPGSIPHLVERRKTRDEKVLLTLQLTVQNPIADTVTIYMEPVGMTGAVDAILQGLGKASPYLCF